jgi:hypothetical protein
MTVLACEQLLTNRTNDVAGYAASILRTFTSDSLRAMRAKEKGRKIMRNSYEMPEALELGSAEKEILGSKPMVMNDFDATWGWHRRTEPLPDDFDESDD